MKIPYSWLNEYVDINDLTPAQLGEKLVGIGFEVEEIIFTGENIENVVTAKVLDVKLHPEADKLFVCMVDVGKEITTIITNAKNVKNGDMVPAALNGACLPSGKKIGVTELKGVKSYGMFCSGKELGIDNSVIDGAEVDGILILPKDTEIGMDIKEVLELNEYILDVSITANRGDCQSIYGIAREVSAVLGRKLKPLNFKYKVYESELDIPSINISSEACSAYTGALIDDVKVQASPKWLKTRLRHCGIRAINNIVDITNYVLLEVGQPLHAFDIKNISGGIEVRNAQEQEKIVALDSTDYSLKSDMLVIADSVCPLAIAGVMGGEHSGVQSDTKTVFLESARFARGIIRTTSRALGLRSDSSARFERGVDFFSVHAGRERALALFNQLGAGRVTQLRNEKFNSKIEPRLIETSSEKICALLGITIKTQAIVKILKSLFFEVEAKGNNLKVTVPLFREDIDNYTDIAEEVIRFYGYDNIKSTLLLTATTTVGGLSIRDKNINAIKRILNCFGCNELATYSFINQKIYDKLEMPIDDPLRNTIKLLNPLSEEFAVMRTQLAANMLSVMSMNINRKNTDFRFFDISKIFIADKLPLEDLPKEKDILCLGFAGKTENFYSMKEALGSLLNEYSLGFSLEFSSKCYMHPGVSADIIVDGKTIGWFGKVHPKVAKNFELPENVYIAEVELANFLEQNKKLERFAPLPKFPEMQRDIAFIVDKDITVGQIIGLIEKSAGELCQKVELFDEYYGEQIEKGCKSLAFNIVYRSLERTLTDVEVNVLTDKAVKAVSEAFNAKLRDK